MMWPKLHALELLRSIGTRSFNTLPFLAIGTEEWPAKSEDLIRAILNAGLGPFAVVRSCAAMEDANAREPPGFFDSVPNEANLIEEGDMLGRDRVFALSLTENPLAKPVPVFVPI